MAGKMVAKAETHKKVRMQCYDMVEDDATHVAYAIGQLKNALYLEMVDRFDRHFYAVYEDGKRTPRIFDMSPLEDKFYVSLEGAEFDRLKEHRAKIRSLVGEYGGNHKDVDMNRIADCVMFLKHGMFTFAASEARETGLTQHEREAAYEIAWNSAAFTRMDERLADAESGFYYSELTSQVDAPDAAELSREEFTRRAETRYTDLSDPAWRDDYATIELFVRRN